MEEARKAKALSEYFDALLQGESVDPTALGEEIEALGELGRSLADIELKPRPAHRAAVERLLDQYRPALQMRGPAVSRTILGMSPRWFFALLVLLVGSILASVVGGLVTGDTVVTEREMLAGPIRDTASPSPAFTLEVASTLPSTPAVPVAVATVSPLTPGVPLAATPTPVVAEDQTPGVPLVATPTPVVAGDQTPALPLAATPTPVVAGDLTPALPFVTTATPVVAEDWTPELPSVATATPTVAGDQTPAVPSVATATATPVVAEDSTPVPAMPEMPDLAFYPAHLNVGGECREVYMAQGSLRNHGPGLAAGVAIDYEVVSGIDWVREVVIGPREWEELGANALATFSVQVYTDGEWPAAGEEATIEVRLFVVGDDDMLGEHRLAEATFTVHNQCRVAEPEIFDLAFYPAYLDAGGECREEYVAQGWLENHGPGLATDVAIDYEVVSGGDWVQEVLIEPQGWEEIATDAPGRFSVTVRTDQEYWPTAGEGSTIVVRLLVVGGDSTAEAFFTVHNQCRVAEPEVYDLEFYPAHLNAGGECREEYVAQGSLKNHGPGLATDVVIDYEVVSGSDWVQEVVIEPYEWAEIGTDKPGRFSVTVRTDEEYWPTAREGATIEVRLFVGGGDGTSEEDLLAEAFFTVHNQCRVTEPEVYDLEFYPAHLNAGGECREEYVAQGSLKNHGPGLATDVAIDYEVVSGSDWVQEVVIEPYEWAEIGTDKPGRFSVAVHTDEEYWPTAREGATIEVRLYVGGGDDASEEDALAEAFFTVHNQCEPEEPKETERTK